MRRRSYASFARIRTLQSLSHIHHSPPQNPSPQRRRQMKPLDTAPLTPRTPTIIMSALQPGRCAIRRILPIPRHATPRHATRPTPNASRDPPPSAERCQSTRRASAHRASATRRTNPVSRIKRAAPPSSLRTLAHASALRTKVKIKVPHPARPLPARPLARSQTYRVPVPSVRVRRAYTLQLWEIYNTHPPSDG